MSELPKIAQQRLNAATAKNANTKSDAHPGANLLTGFVERNLVGAERERVMAHLAVCSECREVVALSTPPMEASDTAVALQSQRAWMQWKFLRFGAGAALAAVLVGALLLTRMDTNSTPARQIATNSRRTSDGQVANSQDSALDESKNVPAKAPPTSRSALKEDRVDGALKRAEPLNSRAKADGKTADSLTAGDEFAKSQSAAVFEKETLRGNKKAQSGTGGAYATAPVLSRSRGNMDQMAAARPEESTQVQNREKQEPAGVAGQNGAVGGLLSNSNGVRGPEASSIAMAPMPRSDSNGAVPAVGAKDIAAKHAQPSLKLHNQIAADVASPPSTQARADMKETLGDRTSSPSPSSQKSKDDAVIEVSSGVVAVGNSSVLDKAQSGAAKSLPVFRSGNRVWRISNGKLQRAVSNGSARLFWKDVALSGAPKFRALAVNDENVWAGGDDGVLYHSNNNGDDWERVTGEWTGNITNIELHDTQRGEFETSTHEKWATTDAGKTWQKQ